MFTTAAGLDVLKLDVQKVLVEAHPPVRGPKLDIIFCRVNSEKMIKIPNKLGPTCVGCALSKALIRRSEVFLRFLGLMANSFLGSQAAVFLLKNCVD